ncbi:MAG: hypothetical protein M3R63_18525 [Actinomycetota bacterium]|nr:hypothetical protein [Actinomycetota bacterium]
MIAVLLQVPLVDGKPQLDLPAGIETVRDGRHVHVSWGDDRVLTLVHLGTPAGGPVFVGMMTARVAQALQHLGAKVMRLRDAWLVPATRTWLLGRGVAEINGAPVPPHVIAGGGGGPDADVVA